MDTRENSECTCIKGTKGGLDKRCHKEKNLPELQYRRQRISGWLQVVQFVFVFPTSWKRKGNNNNRIGNFLFTCIIDLDLLGFQIVSIVERK